VATATKQPGQADNDQDERYNTAQNLWDQEQDFSSRINDIYRGTSDVVDDIDGKGAGVGGFIKNLNADEPEATRQALQNGEENADKVSSSSETNSKERQGFWGKLTAGSKGYMPTGGVIGIILGLFGLSSAVLSPMSLLVNFADIVSNHTSLGDHLFVKAGNSYVASFLKGEGRDCATSKIKCKFTTISEERMKEWEKRGIKVDVDPNKTALGRYKVRGLEYKNTKVRTISEYKNLKYTNAEFSSLLKRFPVRAYLLDMGPFRKGTLGKFGLNIGNYFKSSTDEDKKTRAEENNKAMNEHTKAPVDENGTVTPEKVKGEADEKTKKAASPLAEKMKSLKTAGKVASGTSVGAVAACMAYDTIRAAQAAMTLYWHQELIDFALPFLQAGAKAKEAGVNGGFDWQTAEYFGDRLTTPITQKDVDENPDLYTSDMIGKTAMDSKGMDAALGGSYADVNSGYASKYNGWAPSVLGDGVVKKVQELVGADNIRTACNVSKIAALASSVTCLASLPKCAFAFLMYTGVTEFFGDDILKYVLDYVEKPALDAIAAANLSSSLVGPPLGQALVSASGVMTSYMDRASGFPIAGDGNQVKQAYNDMYNDEDYIKSQIADGRQKAKDNQFDTSNKYSFAGQLVSKFATIPWDGTLFSSMANMVKITTDSPTLFGNASAMQQGIYQPIEIYNSDQQIEGTMENCQNPGPRDINMPCLGESGRTVPIVMPNVQDCLNQEEAGGELCINKAIDYLSTKAQYKGDDDKEHYYIDGNSGEPTDFGNYKENAEEDYTNPMMMFMQYCGRDRVYPVGYTDKSSEDGAKEDGAGTLNDDWYNGPACAASSSTQTAEVCQNGSCNGPSSSSERDTTLGWMSYYYTMCIAMMASEEGQNYCWDEAAKPTPSGGSWVVPTVGTCTSPYGQRWGKLHAGIDLAPPAGTPIVAPTDMIIISAGNKGDGYGNSVVARATDGTNYMFRFGHMIAQPPVSAGQTVTKGTVIGNVGSTGDSTGPHLHFEIYDPSSPDGAYASNGKPIDPVPVLAQHGVSVTC